MSTYSHTVYLLGTIMNVSQLHQLPHYFHPIRAIGGGQGGQHHGRVASVVLDVHVAHTCTIVMVGEENVASVTYESGLSSRQQQ